MSDPYIYQPAMGFTISIALYCLRLQAGASRSVKKVTRDQPRHDYNLAS